MRSLKLFILFLAIIFLLNPVSAKFLCGEVLNSDDGMSPAWYDARITYSSFYNSCKVNPEELRFCCDADLDSMGNDGGWNIGDVATLKILNVNTGYAIIPKDLIFTSNAYDIFPTAKLEKVIVVNSPVKKIFLENHTDVVFNISYLENSKNYSIDHEEIFVLNNSYIENKTLSYGVNSILIESEFLGEVFNEEVDIGIIKNFSVSRNLECSGCSNNKIHTNRIINVTLSLEFSHNVTNFKVKEIVPIDWSIVNSKDGIVKFGSQEYNTIEWIVDGNTFEINYSLFSPNESREYHIASYLEDLFLEEEKYSTYTYVKPIKRSRGRGRRTKTQEYIYAPVNISVVKPNLPLVAQNKSLRVAVYSNSSLDSGFLDVTQSNYTGNTYNRYLNFIEGYSINSNLVGDDFNHMSFELDMNESNNLSGLEIYGITRGGKFVSLTGYSVSNGNLEIESSEFLSNVFIFGIKDKLTRWDKVLELFWRVFRVEKVWN